MKFSIEKAEMSIKFAISLAQVCLPTRITAMEYIDNYVTTIYIV